MVFRATILALLVLGSFALHLEHQQATSAGNESLTELISDMKEFQKSVSANTNYSTHITDNKDFISFLERAISS